MAKKSITLAANTGSNQFLCNIYNPRRYRMWKGTLAAQGTFGGGTVAFFVSYDNGVTFIPVKDLTDVVVSFTTNGSLNVEHGVARPPHTSNPVQQTANPNTPQLYCALTGATAPALTISVYDIN